MNKTQRKVKKHFRELHCDWCKQYYRLGEYKEPNHKNLTDWKEKYLSPTGIQKVTYFCKNPRCVTARPEGWDSYVFCKDCRGWGNPHLPHPKKDHKKDLDREKI